LLGEIKRRSPPPRTILVMEPIVRLRRLGYRVAYTGLRFYWLFFRPHVRGVKCVLTHGEDVLLVRHTYGPRGWDLPGGSVKRSEEPKSTARREMREELGVDIETWRFLGQLEVVIDHKHDRLYCFQAELARPDVAIDLGELSSAQWFPAGRLPAKLGRYTRLILDRLPEPA
jgi:8-oxo-dGTP pyrophosphatase MutT (NUDIX family)